MTEIKPGARAHVRTFAEIKEGAPGHFVQITDQARDEAVRRLLFSEILKKDRWEAGQFHRLFTTNEGDQAKLSEDDYELFKLLALGTRDPVQIERMADMSPRQRPRWENTWSGSTWLKQSIQHALDETAAEYHRRRAAPPEAPDADAAQPVVARTFAEIWADPDLLKLRDPVIPRIAWRGRVTAYSAPDKAGKSTLLSAGVVALATGGMFLSEQVAPGVALWCLLEEHPGDFLPRIKAMGNPGASLIVFEQRPTIEDIRREVVERQAAVVVIDTLMEWAGDRVTETGQAAQWAPIMRELRTMARELNVAVVLLHHARRSDGKAADSRHITAQCDVVLEQLKLPKETSSGLQEIQVRGRWIMADFKVRLVDGHRCVLASSAEQGDSEQSTAKPSEEEKKVLAVLVAGLSWKAWKAAYLAAGKGRKEDTFKTCAKRLRKKNLVVFDEDAETYSPDQFTLTQEQAA